MVSLQGNHEAYDCLQMYNLSDLNKSVKKPDARENTLLSFFWKNPLYKKYSFMVELAGYEGILDSSQANCTLLIPSDADLEASGITDEVISNMSSLTAIKIVKYSILQGKVSLDYLRSSEAMYIETRLGEHILFEYSRMYGLLLNREIQILDGNKDFENGYIHLISGFLSPSL